MNAQKFVIMYAGKYPIKIASFVRAFSLCDYSEATRFPDRQAACNKGRDAGVLPHNLTPMTEAEAEAFIDLINRTCPVCKQVHTPFCNAGKLDCPHCNGDGHAAEVCPHQ